MGVLELNQVSPEEMTELEMTAGGRTSAMTSPSPSSPFRDEQNIDVSSKEGESFRSSDDFSEGESAGLLDVDTEKGESGDFESASSKKSHWQQFVDILWMSTNVLCTVIIVFLNKTVFSDPQLGKCQISIAIWHFTATSIVLYISSCRPCRAFERVRLPVRQVLPICAFFAGFLLLGNLSLALNSVDFYQLAKVMTTPAVVALNFILFRKYISSSALVAVLATCVGVGLVSAKSFTANAIGCIVAAAAFTVTAFYQVWIGKKIEDLKVSPPQLLLNQAPVAVLLLILIAPFVDTLPDFRIIPSNVLYTLFLSGLVASLLNLSQFFIIGRTSAVTFNVVSQVKTILIIGLSWISGHKHLSLVDIIGVLFALGGAAAYTHISRR
ncbi:hypothetical protein LTR10_014595 [Elasticomyces elasticus]|uniref:Sugar phosphate transporter domain-containing protein n=1 Tax=Exophiala sideris TaxID=1016849 RepID=A0ABR0JSR0_9EURO|nr:hypothetical protein LTR10_014595 [Elasticomyces elasticus]KAK5040574.1 hypothetical protein LTS07_001072 [Exophiala sideris]KAK5043002.1 hypothetical protein LTR13_000773 [Exophiala sideris]KAK5068952.1 hypothetical protein LTR69_001073 [Exophiala sideris]KAK5186548.1 hypothetical protein LTR44_001604 [Eurotiomycetes sp. CCFEE 6388]